MSLVLIIFVLLAILHVGAIYDKNIGGLFFITYIDGCLILGGVAWLINYFSKNKD
jgi:hypothetical protein